MQYCFNSKKFSMASVSFQYLYIFKNVLCFYFCFKISLLTSFAKLFWNRRYSKITFCRQISNGPKKGSVVKYKNFGIRNFLDRKYNTWILLLYFISVGCFENEFEGMVFDRSCFLYGRILLLTRLLNDSSWYVNNLNSIKIKDSRDVKSTLGWTKLFRVY